MVGQLPESNDTDLAKLQPHQLTWRVVGAGLLALGLLVLLVACVLWIPKWLYPSLTQTDLHNVADAVKVQELKAARLQLQNDARASLLQGIGGLLVLAGAGIGAYVTLRGVRATFDQITATAKASNDQLKLSYDQLDLTEQGQITDRYTKAIDQLGNNKALAVRLGGLYALERIARDSPDDRATIAEVLCAYARTAPRPQPPAVGKGATPPVADAASEGTHVGEPSSLTVRAPDVQAALTVLGRWQKRLGEPPPVLDLHNADLQGASLIAADLQHANLDGAQLQHAGLSGTKLQHATLMGAQLQDAELISAQLQHARLLRAQLQRANLTAADLQDADLTTVNLQSAFLISAQLQRTNLFGADLRRAGLDKAQLGGAHSLELAQMEGTWADKRTSWPEGWDRTRAKAAGVRFNDESKAIDATAPDQTGSAS